MKKITLIALLFISFASFAADTAYVSLNDKYTTTATAGGTTTLTSSSNLLQYFTGSSNQTVVLPVASTLIKGRRFNITNNGTGTLTINTSGGFTICALTPDATVKLTCILNSGVGVSSWAYNTDKKTIPSVAQSMVTVICGNSISVLNQYSSGYGYGGSVLMANVFAGQPMRFKRVTASTRTDRNGNYGYSGASLATILGDLEAQWFAPLAAANVTPELVFGEALVENDINGGSDSATIANLINKWIYTVRGHWAGCKIMMCTPHPGHMFSTTAKQTVFSQITNYVKSLDNGSDIFVIDMGFAASTITPAYSKYVAFVGSISTTTLTVTSATAGSIRNGSTIFDSTNTATTWGIVRRQMTGTTGGVGTYLMSASNTLASQRIWQATYTDNQVHPNNRGGVYYGREMAKAFARIASTWSQPYYLVSNCIIFDGTGAASGTNTTGTICTNLTNGSNASGTYVLTANQPFQTEQLTASAVASPSFTATDLAADNTATMTLANNASFASGYLKMKIVSGADNLRELHYRVYLTDASGAAFREQLVQSTNDTDIDWLDGDILTFITPPEIPVTGYISAFRNYMNRVIKIQGGTTTIQYLASGLLVDLSNSAFATLDFPSTTVGNASDLTITLTGAAVGDLVTIGIPDGVASGMGNCTFTGWVSAANTVKIRFGNANAATTVDPASATYRVGIVKP